MGFVAESFPRLELQILKFTRVCTTRGVRVYEFFIAMTCRKKMGLCSFIIGEV